MTVLFVLATLALFLAADYIVQRIRHQKAAIKVAEHLLALGQAFQPVPQGVRLQANHTWSRVDGQGIVTIGVDEFLAKFLGAVESIAMPQSGDFVESGARKIRLEDGRKAVALAAAVSGKVVSVNEDVLRSPSLTALDPYGRGWLMKVQVEKNARRPQSNARLGADALQWLQQQAEAARDFFLSREGNGALALAQDGGEPVAGILKQYHEADWRAFQERFLDLGSREQDSATTRSN